jgi:glycosyltransferase involved in cell wall biosynthesis
MNVIHVVPAVSNEASGPSYAVVRLCESLIDAGESVTLAALDWAPIDKPPTCLRTFPTGIGPRRLGRSPAMYRWLDGETRSGRVALLHKHSLWMMPNVYPGWVARRHGTPLVVSPRGTLSAWAIQSGSAVKTLFWPLVQRPALAATTCFHATALSEYEDIRRRGFRQPVVIIPNGIDIPDLPLVRTAKRERTLLFLGRIHPVKGLDLLLPAWRAVQRRFPDWRLRIVGPDNGGYLTTLRRMAQELALERFEFTGPLYGERKWRAYQEADLFVLPTYSENFGMSVAEALAASTPAIVSKGAPWAGLEKHRAGRWIDIGMDALAATLDEALALSPDELATMGRRGRQWMEAEFSWMRVGAKMAESYRWIVQGGIKPVWVRGD